MFILSYPTSSQGKQITPKIKNDIWIRKPFATLQDIVIAEMRVT